jgi:Prokaryotic Cytochrome C oxidase subunit IV
VSSRFNTRLFIVWLILVAITVAYLLIDHAAENYGVAEASTVVTVVAICIALIKVRIIMREFMEVRNAPSILCRLADFWVVLMGAAMLTTYLVGRAVA